MPVGKGVGVDVRVTMGLGVIVAVEAWEVALAPQEGVVNGVSLGKLIEVSVAVGTGGGSIR
jgi:hypothetical protein